MPKDVREAAAAAADRRKITLGDLVCRALDREIQAEREPLHLVPSRAANTAADLADVLSAAETKLAVIERAIAAAVALSEAPDIPVAFRRRANRLLRETLPTPALRIAAPDQRLIANGVAS